MHNGAIAAYLIGEIIKLNDGRIVLYINYLYTSKYFRNRGLASKLIDVAEQIVKAEKLDGLMLTCDTENNIIYNFYLKKGFMTDLILRRYEKYDVLYK
jgi:ribosomal protein S18 acetylase RimI-like enzyme